jgi:hypothetical protein
MCLWCCWKDLDEQDLMEFILSIGFRMWEILIFKWFLPLKIQINSKKPGLAKKKSVEDVVTLVPTAPQATLVKYEKTTCGSTDKGLPKPTTTTWTKYAFQFKYAHWQPQSKWWYWDLRKTVTYIQREVSKVSDLCVSAMQQSTTQRGAFVRRVFLGCRMGTRNQNKVTK